MIKFLALGLPTLLSRIYYAYAHNLQNLLEVCDAISRAQVKARADLAVLLDALSENERTVLRLRLGLDGEEPMTLEAIGQRMGLTRERVRQIEAAGLKKLRGLLASRGVDPEDLFLPE